MATASREYEIFLGSPVTEDLGITFVAIESSGDPRALSRLVHPDASLAPIVYWSNPDRRINFDQDVLISPLTSTRRMLEGTQTVRFERTINDMVITEMWRAAEGTRLSVPTSFFRLLYEYLINPPAYSATAQTYIQWEPRDRNSKAYNIELLRLVVGGGAQSNQIYDVVDLRPEGGWNDWRGVPGDGAAPLDNIGYTLTGALDRTMIQQFKIVSEV
jgi:hypothetical protein